MKCDAATERLSSKVGFGGSKSFEEFHQWNATRKEVTKTAVKPRFEELNVRYGKCMEGLGSLHREKAKHIAVLPGLTFFPLSPLCPWPITLDICFLLTLCHSLSPGLISLSPFLVSWGLSPPALHPQRAQQPCLAQAGRVPALTEGYSKLHKPFCSLPWHLGPTGDPEGNIAFSPSFICVERVILNCVWLILFRDTFLDVHISLFLSEEVEHY